MDSSKKTKSIFSHSILCIAMFLTTFQSAKCEYVLQKELTQVQSVDDLCQFLQPEACELMKNLSSVNYTSDGDKVHVTGGSSQIAMFDACNPRMLTVEIPSNPMVPDATVFPPCTRAMQCGGCCTSAGFSCEPTETQEKLINVVDLKPPYPGAVRMSSIGVRGVKIVEHTKCKSQCTTKQSDCHPSQIYSFYECRCKCSKARLALKATCSDMQIWDARSCRCICPNKDFVTCPVNQEFNMQTCSCTLQHSVAAEIDIEKLIAYIEKGVVDADILLKKQKDNTEVLPEIEELKSESGSTTSSPTSPEQVPVTSSQDGPTTVTAPTDDTVDVKELPVTTTSFATTTSSPAPTPDPCLGMKCFGIWKPMKLDNGKCVCRPQNLHQNTNN